LLSGFLRLLLGLKVKGEVIVKVKGEVIVKVKGLDPGSSPG
jgi:hypothetical protein